MLTHVQPTNQHKRNSTLTQHHHTSAHSGRRAASDSISVQALYLSDVFVSSFVPALAGLSSVLYLHSLQGGKNCLLDHV